MADATLSPGVRLSLHHPEAGSLSAEQLMPYLTGLSYEESVDSLDVATLSLAVPQTGEPGPWLPMLLPGATLTLEWLSEGDLVGAASLDVVSVSHSNSRGRWSVNLQALEPLQRLRGVQVSLAAEEGEVFDLLLTAATAVMGGSSKSPGTSPEAPLGVIVLDDSLLSALKQAALRQDLSLGATATDTGTPTIVAEPMDNAAEMGTLELSWMRHVRSSSCRLDLSSQVSRVDVFGLSDYTTAEDVDPAPGSAPKAAASGSGYTGPGLLSLWKLERVRTVKGWSQAEDAPRERAGAQAQASSAPNAAEASQLDREALRLYEESCQRFVHARVEAIGQPTARRNGELRIPDGPWPFRGPFRIESVSHEYDPDRGLTTSFSLSAPLLEALP